MPSNEAIVESGPALRTILADLSEQLCARLTNVDGLGVVSLWQLRKLLRNHPSPHEAVASSSQMTQPRHADDYSCRPLLMKTFLQRAGLLHVADKFKRKGVSFAEELLRLKSVDDIVKYDVRGKDAHKLHRLLKNDATDSNELRGVVLMSRENVLSMFLKEFGSEHWESASQYATRVTTCGGIFGKASMCHLQAHMEKHKGNPRSAIDSIEEEILTCVIEKPARRQAPPVSKSWIFKVLRKFDQRAEKAGGGEHKLAKLAPLLENARITTRNDLLADPLLTQEQLAEIGIKKLGEQRLLMRLIKDLRAGHPSDVPRVGDACHVLHFGSGGRVLEFRRHDNVYKLGYPWGTVYCYDDKDILPEVVKKATSAKTEYVAGIIEEMKHGDGKVSKLM